MCDLLTIYGYAAAIDFTSFARQERTNTVEFSTSPDEACLTPASLLTPAEIKAIREKEAVSQPVFARYLNVSKNLVSDWEREAKRPGGPALRLLTVVRKGGLRAIG